MKDGFQPLSTLGLDARSRPNANSIHPEHQRPGSSVTMHKKPRRHQSFSATPTDSRPAPTHYRKRSMPNESPPKPHPTHRSSNPGDASIKPTSQDMASRPHHSLGDSGLSRHGTLLTANATPSRAAAELKSILGNHNARLKSKAALLRVDSGSAAFNQHVTLEQAKLRARVEVDIRPQSNTCVQGGHLRGRIKIYIRQGTGKENPIYIAGGKIRVIGFESLGDKSRSIFYQCSAVMSSVAPNLDGLYASDRDEEGFAQAKEGEHEFPFTLYLSMSAENGQARGSLRGIPGISINYIAMVSLKIKDEPDRRSIAHFYRAIEVWPRLDPTAILSPALRPLQASVSTAPSKNSDSGRIKLTASLHRLHWVSGQFCRVRITVVNDTNKTLKEITLSLHRTTTIYPHTTPAKAEMDVDSHQTSVSFKQIAESILYKGQSGAKGHASAKGWWLGVSPGQTSEFEHSILIPVEALTVPRGQLFQVEHSLRVDIDSGSRRVEDVQVMLPIRILGFLSIDPPPSQSLNSQLQAPLFSRPPCSRQGTKVTATSISLAHSLTNSHFDYIPHVQPGHFIYGDSDPLLTTSEDDDSDDSSILSRSLSKGSPFGQSENGFSSTHDEPELGNLSVEDDTDEVVQHAVTTARTDPAYGGFSDLYYASHGEESHTEAIRVSQDESYEQSTDTWDHDSVTGVLESLMEEIATPNNWERDPCGTPQNMKAHRRSSFAVRVEEKTRLATAAYLSGDWDNNALRGQHQSSSTEHSTPPSKKHCRSNKPHLTLKIPPVLDGECNQGSRGPSIAQQLHRHSRSGTEMRVDGDKNNRDLCMQSESFGTPARPSSSPSGISLVSTAGRSTHDFRSPSLSAPPVQREQQEYMNSAHRLCSHCATRIAIGGETRVDPSETGSQTQQDHLNRSTPDLGANSGTSLPRVPVMLQTSVERASVSNAQVLTTPTSTTSATSYTSTTSIGNVSVKDKVRELEERAKAATSS